MQYLERRFGVYARRLASMSNFIQLVLYTGVVLYAPSLALEATTGLSGTMSVALIGLICMFYSGIGGIKAVIVTDVFQGILMFASLFCVIGVASTQMKDGLFTETWNAGIAGKRIDFSE